MIRVYAAALLVSLAASTTPAPMAITREMLLMGTRVTLSTWDGVRARGVRRLEALLTPLEATDRLLSTWKPDSEVSHVNAASSTMELSPSLCDIFRELDDWVAATGGAFDPAIGTLTRAWGIHDDGRLPTDTELRTALATSGWPRLSFDPRTCKVAPAPGVAIDVGGFGKGAALDAARAAVGDREPWLIDMGGQVAVGGSPPGTRGWKVAIADPRRRHRPVLDVWLSSGSLSTSGGSERDLRIGERRIGHILDPHTGYPAPFTGAVSVWHERALAADVLSTALFVMGPAAGLRWADAHGVAACYLLPDGRTQTSRAFQPLFGRP